MDEQKAPPSLDTSSRNERLRDYLLSLGLLVEPVFRDDTTKFVKYLRVSAGPFPLGD